MEVEEEKEVKEVKDKDDECHDKLKVDEVDKDVMMNVSRFARA